MLQITIREAYERFDDQNYMQHIYLYKEHEVVFFVGRSRQPFERLRQHLGEDTRNLWPDGIGSLILKNQLGSLKWLMGIWAIQELAPQRYEQMKLQQGTNYEYESLAGIMETAAIQRYKPCLNGIHRYERTPLPVQYRTIANADMKISEEG